MASRVSTWKQRIEKNLEEQDARPPFDIHKYGERILDKLSVEQDQLSILSFGDVVRGQEKHDIARTFSALLQLVNNGDVDLVKSNPKGSFTCYSDVNCFQVRLLRNGRRSGVKLQSFKRRAKTPSIKGRAKIMSEEEKENQVGKSGAVKCTPEGKKRRKSGIIGKHFAG